VDSSDSESEDCIFKLCQGSHNKRTSNDLIKTPKEQQETKHASTASWVCLHGNENEAGPRAKGAKLAHQSEG